MHQSSLSITGQPLGRLAVNNLGVRLLPAGNYEARFRTQTNILGFAFDWQTGQDAIGTDRRADFRRLPNSLSAIPADCDVFSMSAKGGEYLVIDGLTSASLSAAPFSNRPAGSAITAAYELRRMILRSENAPLVAIEQHVQALLAAVCSGNTSAKAARWMTASRLQQTLDLIEANHCHQNLTVGWIASQLGLSASFLSRAFVATCGQSLFDYILSRRVQTARMLLAKTPQPIPEVALAAGFSSQSHMTSSFSKRLGTTPAKYRHQQAGARSP